MIQTRRSRAEPSRRGVKNHRGWRTEDGGGSVSRLCSAPSSRVGAVEDAGRGGQRARAPGFCRVAMPSGDALSCISWCELTAPWVVRAQAHYPQSVMSVFRTPSTTWGFWLVLLLVCHAPIDVHSVTVEQHSDYQTCLAYTSSCTSMCAALPPAPGRFLATARKKRTSEY